MRSVSPRFFSSRARLSLRLNLWLLLCLTLSLGSGCTGEDTAADKATQAKATGAPTLTVEVLTLHTETISNREMLSGRVRARQEAEIRPQVTGILKRKLFAEGQEVKAGQALYKIDAAEYQVAYNSAKAALARARSVAKLKQATAKRIGRLAKRKAISQQGYDEAQAAANQAQADIDMQKALLEKAELDLSRTTITAPISGRIGRSAVTPGTLLTQNQAKPLARILQLDPVNLDLSVSSHKLLSYRQQVASGQIASDHDAAVPAQILLENGSQYSHEGRLEFSEFSVDESMSTVVVRATVPNPDGLLLPGMYLQALFDAGQYVDVIAVPQQYITRNPRGQAIAYVVNKDSLIEERQVKELGRTQQAWIIKSGLQAGDRIVTSNLQKIRAGMAVNSKEVEAQ